MANLLIPAPSPITTNLIYNSLGYDVASYPGIVNDLLRYRIPLTYTFNSTAVQFGNTLTSTNKTITAKVYSNSFRIVGSLPASSSLHRWHPCTVTLDSNTSWSGVIQKVTTSGGDQLITLNTVCPKTVTGSTGQTVDIGVNLTAADQGKSVWAHGTYPRVFSPMRCTIGTVTSRNTFNATSVITNTSNPVNSFMNMAYGTDNYAVLKTLAQTALAAGYKTLLVNVNLFSSSIPHELVHMIWRGTGELFFPGGPGFSDYGSVDVSPNGFLRKFVIPFTAPPARPSTKGVSGIDGLSSLANTSTPKVAFVGASTFVSFPDAIFYDAPTHAITTALQTQNPGKVFTFGNFAEGGQAIQQYSNIVVRNGSAEWDLSTGTPWIGGPDTPGYVYNFLSGSQGSAIGFELSSNDILQPGAELNGFIHLHSLLKTWPVPPNPFWVLNPTVIQDAASADHAFYDSGCRLVSTWCKVNGLTCIDIRRQWQQARDGFDAQVDRMVQGSGGVPGGALSNSSPTNVYTTGFTIGASYNGTPAAFWVEVGNQIGLTLNGWRDANEDFLPGFIVGYDPDGAFPGGVADTIYIQGNITSAIPGAGLPGGAVPAVLGGYSISAGNNVLNYAPAFGGPTNVFSTADDGKIITIPKAGSTDFTLTNQRVRGYPTSTNVGVNQPAPLVGYMKYISGTQVQIYSDSGLSVALNAVTAVSNAAATFILRGSPRVYTNISGIAADAGATATFKIGHQDDRAFFKWGNQESKFIDTLIVKSGYQNSPIIMFAGATSNLHSKLTVAVNAMGYNDIAYASTKPFLCATSVTDDELLGGAGALATDTQLPASDFGGNGGNHPGALFNDLIIRALDTVDLRTNPISKYTVSIASGFGTSPSLNNNPNATAFTLTVGSGGTAATGVITLPAAPTGWIANITNQTSQSAAVAVTKQTASSNNSITLGNFSDIAVSQPWNAGDTLLITCQPY